MSSKHILKKFLSFSIGNYLNIIIGITLIPIVTRILSPDKFGVVSMFILAVNILNIIVCFGNDQSFSRFYYEEVKENKPKLLLQCLKLPSVIFIILSFVILFFSEEISLFLFDGYDKNAMISLVIAAFFTFIKSFGLLIVRMEQKGLKYSVLQFLTKFIDLIFVLIFFEVIGADYIAMIYSYTITVIIVTVITVFYGKELWLKMFSETNIELKNSFKETIVYAYPLVLTIAFVWVFQSIDQFSIKYWNSMNELGLYSAAYKIVALLFIVRTTFTTYWAPLSLHKYQENPENTTFFEKMYLLIFSGMFIVIVGFILCKDLVVYFLGETYRSSVNVLPFLALIPFMSVLTEITKVGISFTKKTKWSMFISIVVCCINLIGNYLLVPVLGAQGAAISTGVTYLLLFVLSTYISNIFFKVDYHLAKTYFFMFLLLAYCFYSSFWVWNFWNAIVGSLLLALFCFSNYRYFCNQFFAMKKLF